MSFDANFKSHMIGFPFFEGQIENQKHNLYSYSFSYKPLYEMCKAYLSNGYSVLYAAESIPNKSVEEKVYENIMNVNSGEDLLS